jgi:hypothetical protein
MKPKKFPEDRGDVWTCWPTLHTLQKANPDITLTQFRVLLRDVPSYRCEDNSVRYDPEATAAAIREGIEALDSDPDEIDGEPRGGERLTLMALYREQTRANGEQRRDFRDVIQTLGGLIEKMGGPLRLGIDLVGTLTSRLESRLTHLEEHSDKVTLLIEDLMDRQAERARAERREALTGEFKKKSFGLVQEHAPKLVEKWTLTQKAAVAVEVLESLEPELLEVAAAQGWLSPEHAAMLARLFPKKKPPPEQSNAEPKNHAGQA